MNATTESGRGPPIEESNAANCPADGGSGIWAASLHCLSAPFDAMRSQYAAAVVAGVAQRSLLASARLERSLHALETLCLGPLARRR